MARRCRRWARSRIGFHFFLWDDPKVGHSEGRVPAIQIDAVASKTTATKRHADQTYVFQRVGETGRGGGAGIADLTEHARPLIWRQRDGERQAAIGGLQPIRYIVRPPSIIRLIQPSVVHMLDHKSEIRGTDAGVVGRRVIVEHCVRAHRYAERHRERTTHNWSNVTRRDVIDVRAC